MNLNPDYNCEMLKLYFLEKDFTKKQQESILNHNPFNSMFINWEKHQLYTNRVIANTMKEQHLISMNDNIHEIVNNRYNSIGKYLFNKVTYSDNIKNFIAKEDIILVRDTIHDHYSYLEELVKLTNKSITGICTRDYNAYKNKLKLYKQLLEEYQGLQMVQAQNNNLNICLIKKCR